MKKVYALNELGQHFKSDVNYLAFDNITFQDEDGIEPDLIIDKLDNCWVNKVLLWPADMVTYIVTEI